MIKAAMCGRKRPRMALPEISQPTFSSFARSDVSKSR
jgi:hypothetical protein